MGNDGNSENLSTSIINRLFLENTRVLFDFMQELSDRCTNLSEPITDKWEYEGYNGVGSLEGREKKLGGLIKEVQRLVNQCYDNSNNLLLQNPLSSYLKFYKEVFYDELNLGQGLHNDYRELKQMAEMLNYFNILRFLTEPEYKEKRHKAFEAFPYILEDLCLSVRNMTGTESAYLVYKKEGEASQIVSRSGYVIKEGDVAYPIDGGEDKFSSLHITASEFDLLIKCFNTKKDITLNVKNEEQIAFEETKDRVNSIIICKSEDIVNGIVKSTLTDSFSSDNPNREFLLFDFPFADGVSKEDVNADKRNEEKRHFYIVLELKDEKNDAQLIIKAMRVLFLRNRLHEAVKKYYAALLNFRFYCNYVQSVAQQEKNSKINILHLTDLHLNDDEIWSANENADSLLNVLLKHLSGLYEEKQIDLIAVTGDIVHYFSDAATAQRKYKRAANLLFMIAKNLWSKGKILPHDWKRRILITTGNHDYVSMGDVRVQTESRKITTGLPAKATGGTMSKYTYYLEFLSYFLDAPTQKLLNSDLNEIRQYDKLNLIIGIFNTCSQANAIQTNKVSFDSEKLELVLKRSNWGNSSSRHIALAHHYPSCPINYFDDKYEWWRFSNIETCYVLYILSLGQYLLKEKRIEESEVLSIDNLEEKKELYEICKEVRAVSDYCEEFDKKFSEFRGKAERCLENNVLESELFKDMAMLQHLLEEKKRYADEYIFKFLSDASSLFKTIAKDKQNFDNDWCKIKSKNLAVIAGHTHQAQEKIIADCHLMVGHKFYDKDSGQIVFEIISVDVNEVKRELIYL